MARLPKCAVGMAALLLGQALLSKADVWQPPSGTWASTGAPMTEARTGASATLLPDGHVLIAGGTGAAGPLATAELYDSSGFFTATTPMHLARARHVCVVLQDGRVLVAGGVSTGGDATASAEIYDPTTAAWSIVGEMAQARSAATAILLTDGRVLVAGGRTGLAVTRSLEMFDPATNLFAAVGSLSSPRKGHAAALLPDGRVLIAGGTTGPLALASTDIYDPSTGLVSPGPPLSTPRVGLSATALPDGKVLAAGGNDGTVDLDTAEVYDPAALTFSPTAGRLVTARRDHIALLLPLNNNVLIVGGMSGDGFAESAELYAPWNATFTPTGAPSTPRDGAAASALQIERQLLVAGGAQAGAELYGFATIKTDKTEYAPGETVVISGSGWQPLETVNVLVQENPKVHDDRSLPLVADQDGNVLNQDLQPEAHDVPLTFSLRAADAASEAQTTFTDAAAAAPVTSCTGQPNGTLCDDGNPCTEGEKCQNQNCVGGNPAPSTTTCSDGNACTTGDHCAGKVCVGTAITCTASDQCHDAGTCNPSTGVCSNPAKADGSACNDGNACTQTDACQSGTCTGSNPVVCPADQCHDPGTCNPSSGTCSPPTSKANGTACNDGNACTQTDACQNGTCSGSNPVVCPADQCHNAGTCNPSSGTCSAPTNKADGTACNDGDACTQTDTCQNGSCQGSNPVTCTALDQCHDAGTCDTATGICSNPAKANGTACNDGNACTQTDTCQAGTCTGSNSVVCTAQDQCHDPGTCNPTNGMCSNPPKLNGSACNDGNACTQTDTCVAGQCVGTNPVVCTASDQCHSAGTCNMATGMCSNPAKPNGTSCSDGNACTQTDTCQNGSCQGANPVTCTALDQCHNAGTCNPGTGLCSNPNKSDGTACNDGNACTQSDSCQAGVCLGANPVICTAADQCHVAGVCNPVNGVCSSVNAPDGTACNDANECTAGETCQSGTCTGGQTLECKVTGGGQINVVNPNGTANFGFNVQTDAQTGSTKGQLEYNNHATSPPTTYHSVAIDPHSLVIVPISSCTASPTTAGKRATFTGTVKRKNDGTNHPFTVMVEDCGEPGRGKDYFSIQITGGDTQAGPLISGNIQIHGTSVNGTSVTGAGGGVFPPAALYNGVSLQSLTFGKGLTVSTSGPAQGQFQALLMGLSALGVTQKIKVEGKAASGSCPGANTASFSGTGTVDMGDGTPPVPGVPFTVMVVTNTDGTGSLALGLGATNLPAATINEGYMTIK